MLSINIPVYNYEVSELVSQLAEQADDMQIVYEIRVYDDGSKESVKLKNCKITGLTGVIYKEIKTNLGRSAIRNKILFSLEI